MAGEEKNWLDAVQEEIKNVDLSQSAGFEPRRKILAGEDVVGEMTGYEKKLHVYLRRCAKELEDLSEKADNGEITGKNVAEVSRMSELFAKYDILEEIFFHTIRARLSLWLKALVGIRKGWKIIAVDEPVEEVLETATGSFTITGKAPKGWM